MKLEIGYWLQFHLAQRCAEIIHGAIISRHLKRVGIPSHWNPSMSDFDEVCALLRSLPAGHQGNEMRYSVRYWLKELKKEQRTQHCWQDYVRSVAQLNGVPCPGANTDPAWATFILKDRAAA